MTLSQPKGCAPNAHGIAAAQSVVAAFGIASDHGTPAAHGIVATDSIVAVHGDRRSPWHPYNH